MKLIDPVTGQAVWDSNDPNAGPVPPAPEGREWVRLDEPGDTMAPRRTAPGILDIGNGVIERLAFLNQTFNPVEGIGGAMRAGSRMMAPDQSYWDRIASLGEMASGVASVAAPIAAAKAIGVPAASAMMEGILGWSPTQQAAGEMATQFARSESGALTGAGSGRPPLTFDEVARAMQEAPAAVPPATMQSADEILNLGDDEFVTLYHGTTREGAEKIKQTGALKSAGEPSVYLTTDPTGGGYGDGTVVPVRVRRGLLQIDDEFPSGRADFRIDLDRPGGSVPVQIAEPPAAPSSFRLYHGSPHDFDRFSMSKIGTGEGAQAYGPGLYFAENEGIARGYKEQLSRPYYATEDWVNIAEKYGDDVANIFEMAGGEPDDMRATVARLRKIVKENLDDIGVSDVSQLKSEFYGDLPSTIIDFSNRADRLESLLNSGDVKLVNTGRMYEVEVNANPEDFLDWDKPLSEQSKVVQDFANARWQQIYGRAPDPAIEGEYIAKMASPQGGIDSPDWLLRGGPGDAQRERLREAGIPGIRYLDAGSRGAGDGSRNYVIFDENLINIVRKYGIAGAATMLGVSAFDVEQALAENMPPSQWDQLVVGPQ